MRRSKFHVAAAVSVIALAAGFSPARAGDIVQEWANVKAPAALPLKPVTADAKTTALLLLDFVNPNCTNRPRCLAQMPAMKKLLAEARAAKLLIVYSTAGKTTAKDILPDVAPMSGDPVVHSSVDKFQGTDLAKILQDKGIKSVIVTGTSAGVAQANSTSRYSGVEKWAALALTKSARVLSSGGAMTPAASGGTTM